MNDHRNKGQDEDFEDLMSNIERESNAQTIEPYENSMRASPSPPKKLKRAEFS